MYPHSSMPQIIPALHQGIRRLICRFLYCSWREQSCVTAAARLETTVILSIQLPVTLK